jgi:hypothetical protein
MMAGSPAIVGPYASVAMSLKSAFQDLRVVVIDYQTSNLALHRPALVEFAAIELIGSKFGRMLDLEIMPMALKPNTHERFQSQRSRDITTLPHFHEVARSIVDFIDDSIVIFSIEGNYTLNDELERSGIETINRFKSYFWLDLEYKIGCVNCRDHIGESDSQCFSLAPSSLSNSSLATALIIAQRFLKNSWNWKGGIEWVSPMPAWGAGIEEGCYSAAFIKAIGIEDAVSAAFFLARGGRFQSLSGAGGEEMLKAARNGNLEIVKLLIQAGAEIDFSWQSFGSPFGKQLVDPSGPHDEFFDDRNSYGRTPLSYAAESGFTDIVLALVESGADVSRPDANGISPFEYARQKGHNAITDLILKRSFSV